VSILCQCPNVEHRHGFFKVGLGKVGITHSHFNVGMAQKRGHRLQAYSVHHNSRIWRATVSLDHSPNIMRFFHFLRYDKNHGVVK